VLTIRRLRAASGLVLLTYIGLHLANHALGLVSLGTADAARRGVHAVWHSAPGTVLLYGSLVVHMALAFSAVWARRSLRLPPVEVLRLVLGFGLPLLLYTHVAATRLVDTLFGIDAPYARVVNALAHWNTAPLQLALIAIAWTHGCIGVAIMLRANPNVRRYSHAAVAAAVLLPVLGALGFLAMARELAVTGATAPVMPSPAQFSRVSAVASALMLAHAVATIALFAAHAWRARFESGVAGGLRLATGGRVLQVPRGWSVLEASERHGVPHLSLCGGRARCSTCRVRVAGPAAHLPSPNADEARTLQRIHAAPDVRLACQLRPLGDISFEPQLTANGSTGPRVTHEREVAVLFVDLRRWSVLAERQWPHDLVYVLDRYFAVVGEAVRACGGEPNQFIGDSVMAIFGLETDLATASPRPSAPPRASATTWPRGAPSSRPISRMASRSASACTPGRPWSRRWATARPRRSPRWGRWSTPRAGFRSRRRRPARGSWRRPRRSPSARWPTTVRSGPRSPCAGVRRRSASCASRTERPRSGTARTLLRRDRPASGSKPVHRPGIPRVKPLAHPLRSVVRPAVTTLRT